MDEMNIDLNGMYIEDIGASFDQLDDLGDTASSSVSEINAMGQESVEAEDLIDEDSDFGFDDIDEDEGSGHEVEEEAENDEEHDDDEDEEGEPSVVDEDGEEVDFEEYEVTLPNGDIVKLNEAIQGYRGAQEIADMRAAFEEEREQFMEQSKDVGRLLELAKLEAERVIDDYQDFDWATLSREDPQAYVENREFLDRYRARHKEILKEFDRVKEEEVANKALVTKEKARAANEVLSRDIPGWSQDMYVELMRFGVGNLGMSEEFVTTSLDAGLFKALYQARQLAEGKEVVKAKIKKMGGSPKKVVKAAPKTNSQVDSKKAIIKKRLQAGSFDSNDLGMAFDMLED